MTAPRLTKERLDQIRDRVDGASAGPWRAENDQGMARLYRWCRDDKYNETGQEWDLITYGNRAPLVADDAEFIAAAREDVPALLAEVEALEAEIAKLTCDPKTLPPGLVLEYVRLDGMWQDMVRKRDDYKRERDRYREALEDIMTTWQRGDYSLPSHVSDTITDALSADPHAKETK